MKNTLRISFTASFLLLLFSFTNPEKQINKVVSRVWKGQEITMIQLSLPDSLQKDITQINEIRLHDKIIGYACYTSAFACQIGGCAAPSNPNAEAYETFDYIVVYDSSFKILKVEIANYTGQYGYEICRQKWLSQFIGGTSDFKLEETIDGISGATVSATYLIQDLNKVGEKLTFLRSSALL